METYDFVTGADMLRGEDIRPVEYIKFVEDKRRAEELFLSRIAMIVNVILQRKRNSSDH